MRYTYLVLAIKELVFFFIFGKMLLLKLINPRQNVLIILLIIQLNF